MKEKQTKISKKKQAKIDSRCGSVARAVDSDSRSHRFKSSHPGKIYIEHMFAVNCIEKTTIKKKRPGIAQLKKRNKILLKPTHARWGNQKMRLTKTNEQKTNVENLQHVTPLSLTKKFRDQPFHKFH